MSAEQFREHQTATAPEMAETAPYQPEVEIVSLEVSHSETAANIEAALQKVLEQPITPLELPVDEKPAGNQPYYIDREVKKINLKNELSLVQQKLPFSLKVLSKAIHQPAIRVISEQSAKTITRPSGLLGGGILAFCGSLFYLIFTKYVGARYNYLIFLILFGGGFLLGLGIESLIRLSKKTS